MKELDRLSAYRGLDRAGYYGRLLDEGRRGGVSMRALAARHGVSAWTLYEWRRRLRGERGAQGAPSRLVAVDVVGGGPPELEAASGYEVILTDGCRVRVPANFTTARLSELLAVVRSC